MPSTSWEILSGGAAREPFGEQHEDEKQQQGAGDGQDGPEPFALLC